MEFPRLTKRKRIRLHAAFEKFDRQRAIRDRSFLPHELIQARCSRTTPYPFASTSTPASAPGALPSIVTRKRIGAEEEGPSTKCVARVKTECDVLGAASSVMRFLRR